MSKLNRKLLLILFFCLGLSWSRLSIAPNQVHAARKTADEVYVQPIAGLEKTGLFGPSKKAIIKALIEDNYQVYCAAPSQEVSAEIGQEYLRYLELYGGIAVDPPHDLTTTMNAADSILNSLILDDSSTELTSVFDDDKASYVQFFNNSKTSSDPFSTNVVTADYYKMLTLEQQCAFQTEVRQKIIYLCDKLEIPIYECPLNVVIPNTTTKIASVDMPDCSNITDPELIKSLSQSEDLITIANIPWTLLEKRVAYLVTCVEQVESNTQSAESTTSIGLYLKTKWEKFLSSLFGLLNLDDLQQQKDECHVRSIWIDEATTEQEETNSVEAHNISRNILTPYKDQIAIEEKYEEDKAEQMSTALAEASTAFTNDDRVNLVDSANTQTKALTHMINALAPVCTENTVRTETAPTITSEANFAEGGPLYKATQRTAGEDWGLLDSLFSNLDAEIITGIDSKGDLEQRGAIIETFLIAPYDAQITMEQFLTTFEEYQFIAEQDKNILPTHVLFNQDVGEGNEYQLSTTSTSDSVEFWDPNDCTGGYTNSKGEWIPLDCTKTYDVGISNMNQELGVDVIASKTRGNARSLLSLFSYDTPIYRHAQTYSNSEYANNEKLIKGTGGSNAEGDEEDLACNEYKSAGGAVDLPGSIDELKDMICDVAGGDNNDAQLLYGIMKTEATPLLDTIAGIQPVDGSPAVKTCKDLIRNSCGASEITGLLVPQCIDTDACSQAAKYAKNYDDPWIQEVRNNPEVGCDIETQLEYILRRRKSEISWLKEQYAVYNNGKSPSTEELYILMAARNYGTPQAYYEGIFTSPVCQGGIPINGYDLGVDGCDGLDYGRCVMEKFSINCN